MDVLGLLLAVPGALVASLAYCGFLAWFKERLPPKLVAFATVAAFSVLILFGSELVLLSKFGALGSRELVGPIFYHAHRLCFYLAAPSLANLLMLRPKGFLSRWYVAFLPCALLGILAVFVEYVVSDALYGPDGVGGTFGKAPII